MLLFRRCKYSQRPGLQGFFDTAKLLENGFTIVDGGSGVMHAATSGAQADGPTLTVTFDPVNAPGYEGRYLKNVPDKEIVTTNYIGQDV